MSLPKKVLDEPVSLMLKGEDKGRKRNLVKVGKDQYLVTKKAIEADSPELVKLQEVAPLISGIVSEDDIVEVRKATKTFTYRPGDAEPAKETEGDPEAGKKSEEQGTEENSEPEKPEPVPEEPAEEAEAPSE